jgi:hypothetical protein
MPLLPSTATSTLLPPTPAPTATPQPLVSPESVGGAVVIVILVLAAVGGVYLGGVLRDRFQNS